MSLYFTISFSLAIAAALPYRLFLFIISNMLILTLFVVSPISVFFIARLGLLYDLIYYLLLKNICLLAYLN
uniref:Uncharacterized protein n=1 Tax=Meloidogyne enterolobii TaxID=390850 RepID=A0A6V7XU86_MELEN|nr:unnamed protein product [Meloidogyne enterolobii]